jgi:hypothetical protein
MHCRLVGRVVATAVRDTEMSRRSRHATIDLLEIVDPDYLRFPRDRRSKVWPGKSAVLNQKTLLERFCR